MTPVAQSAVFFAVMLGLTSFCILQLRRALHRQNKAPPHPRRVLAPYLVLCAAMDLILVPYLPHIAHNGLASLLVPLCVLGLPAVQHTVLLSTALGARLS